MEPFKQPDKFPADVAHIGKKSGEQCSSEKPLNIWMGRDLQPDLPLCRANRPDCRYSAESVS